MIMINGNWEQVKDLSDILRIVSENIGSEFAQKVEEILEDCEYIEKERFKKMEITKIIVCIFMFVLGWRIISHFI